MTHEREIERELVDQLYARAPIALAVPALMGIAYAAGTWSSARAAGLLLWLALQGAALLYGLVTIGMYRRNMVQSLTFLVASRRVGAFLTGAAWASGAILVTEADLSIETVGYLICLLGLIAGASASHVVDPWSVVVLAICISGAIAWVTFQTMAWLMPLLILFVIALGALGRQSQRLLISTLKLKFANQELLRVAVEQRQVAEQAVKARTRFLAAASHDLRQPMQAIGLFAHALEQAPADDPAERARVADRLGEATRSMSTMLDSLLDISRLDSGKLDFNPENIDVKELLAEVRDGVHGGAAARDVSVQTRGREARVHVDPVILRRVMNNLTANAVRHGKRGGLVLLASRLRGNACELQVWDDGPGIAASDRERIFDEFVQLDNPARDREKGLGLGLPMVSRLCEECGWRLTVRSVPSRGSMFSVQVPMSERQSRPNRPPIDPGLAVAGRDLDVWIVEDDDMVRDGLASTLTAMGCRVTAHAEGTAVKAALESGSLAPNLVITDVRLPGALQGPDIRTMLHREYGDRLRVVMLSGDSGPDAQNHAQNDADLEEPATRLRKPISVARLQALVESVAAR